MKTKETKIMENMKDKFKLTMIDQRDNTCKMDKESQEQLIKEPKEFQKFLKALHNGVIGIMENTETGEIKVNVGINGKAFRKASEAEIEIIKKQMI